MKKVDSLKKIELLLEAGTTPNEMDLTSQPVKRTFIFGIGSEGLTPFECELVNKSPGDEIIIDVERSQIPSRFGSMAQFIVDNIEISDSFYLKVEIVNIESPENREIVKAIAENLKHGDACGCGCGCE
jgi:hypothetical protein